MDYVISIIVVTLLILLFGKDLKSLGSKHNEQVEQYREDVDNIVDKSVVARKRVRDRVRKILSKDS